MQRGFTLVELLMVIVIIAIIAAVSAPMVARSIAQSKEAALREDLVVLRKAIDDYYGDTGNYPVSLDKLVEARYLRAVPKDPMNEEGQWVLVHASEGEGILDVRSNAPGSAADGTPYSSW